jgi:hypothetical protein
MTYIQPQAPHVNGLMELTEEQVVELKSKLVAIQEAFEPTEGQPVLDLFYIVATYNKENPDAVINGDTAQAVLGSGEVPVAIEGNVTTVEIVG